MLRSGRPEIAIRQGMGDVPTDPIYLAADDAATRAEQSPMHSTWRAQDPVTATHSSGYDYTWQRIRYLLSIWDTLEPVHKQELVQLTQWLNNWLTTHPQDAPTTVPPVTTPGTPLPPTPAPAAPPAGSMFDNLKSALASVSTPVKIGGALAIGYLIFGSGSKRR